MTVREAAREVLAAYARNDLLTAASAIAFQVAFALVPLALFGFGLLGLLGLDTVWSRDLAPDVRSAVSPPVFEIADSTVRKVLGGRQLFWVTFGLLLALWEMSGATRSVMGVFDRVYGSTRSRSFLERYLTSFALAGIAGGLLLLTTAVWAVGPLLADVLVLLRWPIALLLLSAVVAALVRMAPADRQPVEWVSFGSLLVVVAWLVTSVGFAFYVRDVANYASLFGALSVVIVAFEYLYLAAVAFLTGAQLDALIRERSEES